MSKNGKSLLISHKAHEDLVALKDITGLSLRMLVEKSVDTFAQVSQIELHKKKKKKKKK